MPGKVFPCKVEVYRIVWGDYGPRYLGEARAEGPLVEIIRQDGRQRLQEARQRVYALRLVCGDHPVEERVVYGLQDDLERSVFETASRWLAGAGSE